MSHTEDEQAYWSARSALIAEEQSYRFDATKASNFTPLESQVDTILRYLKTREAKEVWKQSDDLNVHPGMPFRGAIARGMRDTCIFKIIQKMPKGSALHCHADATCPAEYLISLALRYDDVIHMRCDRPILKRQDLYDVEVYFRPKPPGFTEGKSYSLFDASTHDPEGWMSLREARRLFPFENVYQDPPKGFVEGLDIPKGGQDGTSESALTSWIHSLMTLTPVLGSKKIETAGEAWDRFMWTFRTIGGMFSYEPILRAYFKEMCKSYARDNIQYLETRLNCLFDLQYVATDGITPLPHSAWVQIFDESVEEAKKELLEQEGITFLDAKIIYCTARIVSNEVLRQHGEECISLKKAFPYRIIGFDLVGFEDPLMRLKEYLPELLRFKARVKEEGLDIPFIFHAGETLGDGNGTDQNLYDAILLDTKRIGHGYSLPKHPHLMALCRQKGICVESCPISNEILGYTGSLAQHPLPVLLNNGVPVALSNDDPCQFGNHGLSHDFYQVFTASASATLAALYTFARNSIDHARIDCTDGERARHEEHFERQWVEWLEWVLKEYGSSATAAAKEEGTIVDNRWRQRNDLQKSP